MVADCKVLLSYALSNRSILMAWANSSLSPDTGIEPLDGFESIYHDCDPEHVWQLSMAAADEVGAEALYRAPSPQSWVMLGLWNLRSGGAEQFYSGSPQEFVLRVLSQLADHRELEELPVLLSNYSQSLLQLADHPHKGSDFEEPLRKTARGMLQLRDLAFGKDIGAMRARLTELSHEWS